MSEDFVISLGVSAFFLLVFVTIGYALWWIFSTTRRIRARLRRSPIVELAAAPHEEDVRVVGQVERHETVLTAPITGRPCVLWHVTVLEQRGKTMDTVLERTAFVDFALRDESGHAIVRPMLVTHLLQRDGQAKSGIFAEPSPRIEAFLHEHGISTRGIIFNKTMRFQEAVVELGERVSVLARARWEHDPDAPSAPGEGYRDVRQPKRLILQTPPSEPMIVSDEPRMTHRAR